MLSTVEFGEKGKENVRQAFAKDRTSLYEGATSCFDHECHCDVGPFRCRVSSRQKQTFGVTGKTMKRMTARRDRLSYAVPSQGDASDVQQKNHLKKRLPFSLEGFFCFVLLDDCVGFWTCHGLVKLGGSPSDRHSLQKYHVKSHYVTLR